MDKSITVESKRNNFSWHTLLGIFSIWCFTSLRVSLIKPRDKTYKVILELFLPSKVILELHYPLAYALTTRLEVNDFQ